MLQRRLLSYALKVERLSLPTMKAIEGIPRIAFLGFFSSHIVATLIIDVQAIAPSAWIPKPLADLLTWYASTLNDPLMSRPKELPWFQSLICLEMMFQLPFFFWIVSELSSNRKGAYISQSQPPNCACFEISFNRLFLFHDNI